MQLITNNKLTEDDKIKIISFLEKNSISFKELYNYIDNISLKEWTNDEISFITDNPNSNLTSINEWTDLEILQIKS
ncbi:MAG: hypothetical protein ACRC9H_14000 [Aeromonas veronii]